jgi:AP-2 complex subunit alpha
VSFADGDGVQHEYQLRLPVVASCFFEPVVLNGPDFMARWKNLDGREEKETVTVNPQEFTVDKFRNYVVQGLKMGIAVGVDSATTVTGCGCFTCLCARSSNLIFFRRIFPAATTFKTSTLNQAGAPISVGCLLRIEVNPSNPSQCQITVRSFDSFWF